MRTKSPWFCLLLCLSGLVGLVGCNGSTAYRGDILQPTASHAPGSGADTAVRERLLKNTDPYLKCHFWDGTLIVLQNWRVENDTVSGNGIKYDSQRVLIERSEFHVPIATVALFETNRPEMVKSARLPAMATLATSSVALTALCITTPKACFGSCPTIYATNGEREVLQAEGFSSSVAKALESTDVDALSEVPPRWNVPELRVTNEAPETHAIRSLSLLYAPRPTGGRVYRDGDRYYAAGPAFSPTSCEVESGACLSTVMAADGDEYKSDTDGKDLTTKEQLLVEFAGVPAGELGLVLTVRSSLLGTYLSYQTLAYMGNDWGEHLASIERGSNATLQAVRRVVETLGGVDVQVEGCSGQWVSAGTHLEVGPLARETVMQRLPATNCGLPLRVRLTMTRGNIRLDRVGLVRVVEEVRPRRLLPEQVLRNRQPDQEALLRLLDPERYLVTYPGDEYSIKYPDPHCIDCEWFVESRGYYYTWMRPGLQEEPNPAQLLRLLVAPHQALRSLAPNYQAIEPELDRLFWQSRIRIEQGADKESR